MTQNPSPSTLTKLITVNSIGERDILTRQIYQQLTQEPHPTFTIQQDQVNRIKIFHNVAKDIRVLIRIYLVIVLPVLIDLRPLQSVTGVIDFDLDETISKLQSILTKLQSLQGRHIIKGSNFESTLRELDQCLR